MAKQLSSALWLPVSGGGGGGGGLTYLIISSSFTDAKHNWTLNLF